MSQYNRGDLEAYLTDVQCLDVLEVSEMTYEELLNAVEDFKKLNEYNK